MAPLYEGRARAGPDGNERFGHVVFVNDVYFCAYEVLRCVRAWRCGGGVVCVGDVAWVWSFIPTRLLHHTTTNNKCRLLLYGADLACGLDLFLEPDPGKYLRKGQPEAAATRKELTFYDLWVARDARGRRFQWGPPFARHVDAYAAAADPGQGGSASYSFSKRKERCVRGGLGLFGKGGRWWL